MARRRKPKQKKHEQFKQVIKFLEVVKTKGNKYNTRDLLKKVLKSYSVHKTLILCEEHDLIKRVEKKGKKGRYNILTSKGNKILQRYHELLKKAIIEQQKKKTRQ